MLNHAAIAQIIVVLPLLAACAPPRDGVPPSPGVRTMVQPSARPSSLPAIGFPTRAREPTPPAPPTPMELRGNLSTWARTDGQDPPTLSAVSAVSDLDHLDATVTADLLSCRYGPGPQYLYLYALRAGAHIVLIGRADADNWHWAWVDGANRCWVNTNYLDLAGDWRQLPIVYPGMAKLPISPYYPPTSIVNVVRRGASVTVEWIPIPLRAGDEEDERMQQYILEAWHCQEGVLIFEPLATNESLLTVRDEAGCALPSHARLFVQEKHGFSGPTEVPWPPLP